jgi:tetratricopeptide (TPR) repeat protein
MLRPDDAAAYANMGEAFMKMKKLDDAIDAFKHSIQLKPDYANAYYNLGLAYLTQGDRDSALIQYNILRNFDADSAEKLYDAINP